VQGSIPKLDESIGANHTFKPFRKYPPKSMKYLFIILNALFYASREKINKKSSNMLMPPRPISHKLAPKFFYHLPPCIGPLVINEMA